MWLRARPCAAAIRQASVANRCPREDGTFCARHNVAYVHFDREAASLDEAIRTALDDVRAAGFDVARVDSDEFATICHFNRELAEV